MLADCEGNGLSVGSERTSEVHSEVAWELEKYKELVAQYEIIVASSLGVIKDLIKKRDNAVKSTATSCAAMVGCSCGGHIRIKQEFGL